MQTHQKYINAVAEVRSHARAAPPATRSSFCNPAGHVHAAAPRLRGDGAGAHRVRGDAARERRRSRRRRRGRPVGAPPRDGVGQPAHRAPAHEGRLSAIAARGQVPDDALPFGVRKRIRRHGAVPALDVPHRPRDAPRRARRRPAATPHPNLTPRPRRPTDRHRRHRTGSALYLAQKNNHAQVVSILERISQLPPEQQPQQSPGRGRGGDVMEPAEPPRKKKSSFCVVL